MLPANHITVPTGLKPIPDVVVAFSLVVLTLSVANLPSVTLASNIFTVVTAFEANLASVTEPSAIDILDKAPDAILSAVTAPSFIAAVSTALLAKCEASTESALYTQSVVELTVRSPLLPVVSTDVPVVVNLPNS